MKEHEKLKVICDKIGYNIIGDKYSYYDEHKQYLRECLGDCSEVDVREIIFTQEFKEKFRPYYWKNSSHYHNGGCWWNDLEDNLENPVDYLYKLIK